MFPIYLKNFRRGLATNSSSTHSVIYRNDGEDTWRFDTDYIRDGKWELNSKSNIVYWMPIPPLY